MKSLKPLKSYPHVPVRKPKTFLARPALSASLTLLAAVATGAAEPPLRIERGGSNVVVRFTGSLLSATQAGGPYQPVPGATNPHVVASTNAQQFWRSRRPAGTIIAAGYLHTVVLRQDGTLWTWGNNESGQLGDGTLTSTDTPRLIQADSTWVAVAAGGKHTVALRADGTLWTWGNNEGGQLGNDTVMSTNTPQAILPGTTWRTVAAGEYHSVALREDGTLWAWGSNTEGQLGHGTFTGIPFSHAKTPNPILMSNATWRAVAAGGQHTVALRSDGTLWAWGRNLEGQLGLGRAPGRENSPQPILTNAIWRAVAAGGYHTVALRDDGTLWAWGENGHGQLGDGTFSNAKSPQPIPAGAGWQAVAAGYAHTTALRADGTIWVWGSGTSGALGNDTFTSTNTPQPILTSASWQAVAAGASHTIALHDDGTLWS